MAWHGEVEALFNDLHPGKICANELRDLEHNIFTQSDDKTNVTILKSIGSESAFEKSLLRNTHEIDERLDNNGSDEIRIISISSDDSYSPLHITKPGMEHVLRSLNVSTNFLSVVTSMGKPPHEAEHGSGHVLENKYEDGSFNMSYLSRYYALKQWKDDGHVRRSWKLRQIGVYHSFCAKNDCHTFIFLQPEIESEFHRNLLRLLTSKRQSALVRARPMILHAMLMSCYFDDWRAMIRERGNQFLQDKENLLAQDLKDLKVEARFKRLQFWYDLEDRLAPLEPILLSAQSQLETFQHIDTFLTAAHDAASQGSSTECYDVLPANWFSSRKRIVSNFIVSVQGLHNRTRAILHLIEITLELTNQRKLSQINRNTLELNKKNHVGAENIKVITILTLLFLPASLVSSFFGMNFFDFNETTRNMTTASNTWVYAAVTVPLLVLTVVLWKLVVWYSTVDGISEDEEEAKSSTDDD